MRNVKSVSSGMRQGRPVPLTLTACVGLALLAMTPSAVWAQASGSKLGPHLILTYTNPCNQIINAKPRVIKVLQADGTMISAIRDAKTLAPDCVSVVRIYTQRRYFIEDNPATSAQDFWDNVLAPALLWMSPEDKALIDYVEGPNEGDSTPTWESSAASQWFNDFWLALAPKIANEGFKPCAFSISVGNPPGNPAEVRQHLDNIAPALALCKQLGGAWSYHSYTMEYTTDPEIEIWYSLRYRQYYAYFAPNHTTLVDLPIIFTEGGVDGQSGPEGGGWMSGGDAAKYENWLDWFDARMREDPQVIGCTLFQTGAGYGWRSYDIDPIAPWLASHLNSIGSGPPDAPTGLIATAGDQQVELNWNSSIGATSYDVKRATVTGGPYSVVADDITTTSHTDTGLTNGITYYYVVSAANGEGESGNSNEAHATPAQSSNLIANGDFSNGLNGWSQWTERGSISFADNAGRGHITGNNINGGLWQQFDTGGVSTVVDIAGWWESNPTTANNQWAEVLVINGSRTPTNGQDINDGQSDVEMIYKNDTWATPGGWSGNMDVTSPVANIGTFTADDTVATIILKMGNVGGSTNGTLFDNLVVSSAGTAPPTISLNKSSLSPECDEGSNAPSDSFTVSNSGGGTLSYSISDDASWLSCNPPAGTSTGEADTITVTYSTSSLSPDTYNATITVSDSAATNNPQTIAVTLTVNSTMTTVAEDFESMPSWSSSYDASWGSAASWSIVSGGQSGNALQASRSSQGSSVKVKVYDIDASTDYTISIYIRCPSYGGTYWAETAFKLGNNTAANFDQDAGSWTMIKKFDNGGTNGNGDTWTQYPLNFNSGSNTQISVGHKLGSWAGGGPTIRWDTLRVE